MVGWGQVLRRLSNNEPLISLNDSELLRLYLTEKSADAFACLVRRHGNLVLRLCQRELHQTSDAEDAFQATFLTLAQKAHSIRMTENLAPWLAGVARRLSRRLGQQLRRRQQRLAEVAKAMPPRQSASVEPLWWEEERRHLPEEYHTVIDLCLIQGYSREEAARLLNLSPAAVHGLLYRARLKLKKQLLQRGAVAGASLVATQATAATVDRLAPVVAASAVRMLDRGLAAISSPTVAMLVSQRSQWFWLVPSIALTCGLAGGMMWWNGGKTPTSPTIMSVNIVPSLPEVPLPEHPVNQIAPSGQAGQGANAPAPQQFVPQQTQTLQQSEQQIVNDSLPQRQASQAPQPPRFPVPPADRVPNDAERSMLAKTLPSMPGMMPAMMFTKLPHSSKQFWHGRNLHIGMITSEAEYRAFTANVPNRKTPKQIPSIEKPPWLDEDPIVDWAQELLVIVVLEENVQSGTLRSLEDNWIAPDEKGVAHLMLRYFAPEAAVQKDPKLDYSFLLVKVPRYKLKQVAVSIWRPGIQPDAVGQVPGKAER
ncbi:MAG: sigma-70 family RNA polymerase sigma factor [Gemmatales bacterium]